MTFKIGEQVVCVNDAVPSEQYIEIKKGEIYIVRWIGMYRNYLHGDYLGVRLVGIERGICPQFGDEDTPFRADRFRPLVKDRLTTLRRLLVPNTPILPTIEDPIRGAPMAPENIPHKAPQKETV